MKIITNIIFYLFCVIIAIFSLAMMFIELRLLVCGDFIIYDSPLNGFIRYFFRFLIAIGSLFMVLCEMIKKLRNINFINDNLLIYEMSLLISSIIIFFTTTNYIGVIVLLLMIIFISLKVLKLQFKK